MELTIDFLKDTALCIYDIIHPLIGKKEGANKSHKGAGGDLSMQIDLVAEKTLIDILEQNEIDTLLISEEIGEKYIGSKDKAIENKNILIVDPVDGSNNAVRGIPYCSFSMAYAMGKYVKSIVKAVVVDLSTKDLYWAVKGDGSFFNDKKVHVSNLDIYDNCFIELNFSKKDAFAQIERLGSIIRRFHRIRVLGSTALTLCQIAKGSMEAFINLRESNRLVDVAAGLLILKEAGGCIFSLEGNEINEPLSIDLKFPFIASNKNLSSFLKDELNRKF
ncbi:MAG: hypothetical protein EAX89_03730 [Candidatus Lokiarchaeota archaeon]|nr:hypothetical protein [Candidatus Lokiarchaeota archaeon]